MRVRIAARSQRVTVTAAADATFGLSGRADVHTDGAQVTIDKVRSNISVQVPEGTDIVIGTSSGRVGAHGRLGATAISTRSGRVDVDDASSVDVRATSASVTIGTVDGACRVHTASGRVRIEGCGEADVSTKSGRIQMRNVTGPVTAHSISGRVTVRMSEAHDVHAETVTGRIELSMPAGSVVHQRVPGSPLPPPGAGCTVIARSTTGKVVLSYE
jgi:DUF4097 and DUF4098 domain-containing protein YvlB